MAVSSADAAVSGYRAVRTEGPDFEHPPAIEPFGFLPQRLKRHPWHMGCMEGMEGTLWLPENFPRGKTKRRSRHLVKSENAFCRIVDGAFASYQSMPRSKNGLK